MRSILMRLLPAAAALLSAVCLTGAGQLAPRLAHPSYNDDQKAALDKVSAYLNSIHTLKSEFLQIGPEGQVDQGNFYLDKPGKVRFEYRPPSPVLIVATGGVVYVKNARLNTIDHVDISDTPLGLLLNQQVDLKTNGAVMGITQQDGAMIVNARTSSNRNSANIALVFASPTLELRQWTVRDNQGGATTVALQNPQTGMPLPDTLFAVPVKAPAIKLKESGN